MTTDEREPAIAASSSGAMVIVWLRSDAATGTRAIFGQKFSAAGQPEGAEFQVTVGTGAAIDRPGVDMADDERFTVVWEDDTAINWRRFDASGTPVGSEEKISDTSVASFPAIGMSSTGSGAAVWIDTGTNSSVIHGISFDPGGVILSHLSFASTVVDDSSPYVKTPSVVIDANGAPLVAFVHERRFAGSPNLYCDKVIYASGATEAYAEPGCASSVDELNPHLTVNQNGVTALTWVKLTAGVLTVSARYLNNAAVADIGSGQPGVVPRVALSDNGGAVVKVNGQGVQMRRFGSGVEVGDVMENNLGGAASPEADIAALPDGDYAIVWSATINPSDGMDIMGLRVGSNGEALPWVH